MTSIFFICLHHLSYNWLKLYSSKLHAIVKPINMQILHTCICALYHLLVCIIILVWFYSQQCLAMTENGYWKNNPLKIMFVIVPCWWSWQMLFLLKTTTIFKKNGISKSCGINVICGMNTCFPMSLYMIISTLRKVHHFLYNHTGAICLILSAIIVTGQNNSSLVKDHVVVYPNLSRYSKTPSNMSVHA